MEIDLCKMCPMLEEELDIAKARIAELEKQAEINANVLRHFQMLEKNLNNQIDSHTQRIAELETDDVLTLRAKIIVLEANCKAGRIAELEAKNKKFLELLKELEWSGNDDCSGDFCPTCKNTKDGAKRHREVCRLAMLLEESLPQQEKHQCRECDDTP